MADPVYGLKPTTIATPKTPGSNDFTPVGGTEPAVLADDDDATYLKGTTTTVGIRTYFVEAISAPTGATISSVKILVRVQRLQGGSITTTTRLQFPGGTFAQKSTAVTSPGFKDLVFDYTTQRPGGGTWVLADLTNIEAGLQYSGGTAPVDFRVYKYRLEIGLAAASLPTPSVVSSSFTDVTSTSVKLESVLNPNGSTAQYPTFWTFEYDVPTSAISPDPESTTFGTSNVSVNSTVTGLSPGGTYTFRARIHKGDATYIYGSSINYGTLAADQPLIVL